MCCSLGSVLLRRELDIQIVRSSFFAGSAIARAYIQNESKRFKVFVANRVSEVRQHSSSGQWHHIDGKQNPADFLSRGCDVEKMHFNWFHGLHFSESVYVWLACWHGTPELNDDCKTLPYHDTHAHECTTDTPVHPVDKLSQHYRSLYRMKRAISWLLRFKEYLRHNVIPRGAITASELNAAEKLVLMHVQSREYPDELAALRAGKSVARSSPVLKLDPMIHDGFLVGRVVGGILRHSRLMFQTRHPIILPANHLVSKMIVHNTHGETHFGVEWTLSKMRFKYWIVNARNMIKAVKRACVVCRKLYASPMHQKMSDLPPERCELLKQPFSDTGFDVFGPYYVKHGRSEAKRYGIVFTCFTQFTLKNWIHWKPTPSLTLSFVLFPDDGVRKRFDGIMQQILWADIMSCQRVSVNPWWIILGLMLGRRRAIGGHVFLATWEFNEGSLWWYCILLSVGLCIVYSYSIFCFICKNTKRHTAHTIVSWPNPKQWVIVHTSNLMMKKRQSIYILSIITKKWVNWKHSLTYCIMDNWENMPYLTHALDKIYLTGIFISSISSDNFVQWW